ncbi:MAG: hypothetical protein ABI413_10845 [Ktedonobacteraceae bacterium]
MEAFHLKPGQDTWIHLSLKSNAPHRITAIHIQLSSPAKMTDLAHAVSANSSGCLSITDRETGYENSGVVAYWYQITLTFCYNGMDITALTTPRVSSWTNVFYGIYNYGAQSYNQGTFGWGQGGFNECYLGCLQQSDGYVEIDVYGYGGYSAWRDVH